MKYFVVFIVAFIIPFSVFTQENVTIVISDSNQDPVSDVAVYSNDNIVFTVSNANGEVSFTLSDEVTSINFQHPSFINLNLAIDSLKAIDYKVQLESKIIILEETIISVTKTSQRANQVSNKVDVIKPKEIEFLNPQTSADMLSLTGNVFVQKSQAGGGSPVIRGFEANKVLIVVDGVRMNNAIYRGGHLQNAITIDEAMLARTEVVFGPGSLIYGSDALGGVMHFFTKDPKLSYDDTLLNVFGNASARYASVNSEKTLHFDFNVGGNKFASLTSFSFSDFDDLKSGRNRNPAYGDWGLVGNYVGDALGKDTILFNDKPYLQRGTAYSQYDVLQKFSYQANEYLRLKLNFQYSRSSDIPRFDKLRETSLSEVPFGSEINVFADTVITTDSSYILEQLRFGDWYYGPQIRILTALSAEHSKANKLYNFANYTLSYQFIEESRNERRLFDNVLETNIERIDVFTFNADFKRNLSSKNYVLYGLESNLNTVQSFGEARNLDTQEFSTIQSRYPENGSFLVTNAIYAKHTAEIAEKVTFSQGLRVNHIYLKSKFSERVFNGQRFEDAVIDPLAISFSFDFTFRPKNDWQVNALFSSGFRAPNVDDVGKIFDPNPQEIVIPNSDLKPEYAYNFETGISKTINDKAKIEMVGFFTILSNVITRQATLFNGQDSIFVDDNILPSQVLKNVNEGFGYITGTQINLIAALTRGLELRSSFNYTYGVLKDDDTPMPHIPPIFGRTSLSYKYNRWQTSIWSQYQGWKRLAQYSNNSVDNLNEATEFGTPAWFTLNWTNAIHFNDNLVLNFGVENILDQHYRPFGSGVSAQGRNFTLGIRGSF